MVGGVICGGSPDERCTCYMNGLTEGEHLTGARRRERERKEQKSAHVSAFGESERVGALCVSVVVGAAAVDTSERGKGKGESPAKTVRYSWASTSLSARPCQLRRRSARRTVWLSLSGCSRATRHRRLLLVSPPSPPWFRACPIFALRSNAPLTSSIPRTGTAERHRVPT